MVDKELYLSHYTMLWSHMHFLMTKKLINYLWLLTDAFFSIFFFVSVKRSFHFLKLTLWVLQQAFLMHTFDINFILKESVELGLSTVLIWWAISLPPDISPMDIDLLWMVVWKNCRKLSKPGPLCSALLSLALK